MKYTYELNIQGKPIKNIIIEIKIIMFKVSESIINSFQQFLHIIKYLLSRLMIWILIWIYYTVINMM